MNKKILIVGGVAGGASAAARLRRLDEHAEIIMFEKGEYISFANCGLPYYIGGEIEKRASLILQTPEAFRGRFNVDVRICSEVAAIDRTKKTVTVKNHKTGESYTERYDSLILSPGAEPIKPSIGGVDSKGVFTLRNLSDTDRIKNFIAENKPHTVAIVGGGYIGVEMAENLHKAGLDVTLIEMLNQVIAPLDFDMACGVHRHIESKGVKLLLETAVKSIQGHNGKLQVELSKGSLDVDMLILSIGVRPETGLARHAGLELNERGSIIVDGNMRTSDKDIYAVGDAVEVTDFVTGQRTFIPLAGPANKQGRIAADNICGIESRYTGTQGSAILRVFDMTVATTGVNEKTAARLGLDYDKIFTHPTSHAMYYPGFEYTAIKTLFDRKTGKILGAQVVGFEGCDKNCDVLATAIRFGATAKDLTELELCYAPPYSSAKDPVNMIGFAIENLLSGKYRQIHWHDYGKLPRDGSVIFLDTRMKEESEGAPIGGFINIPTNELRNRLHELDKNKTIYVSCRVGLQGYITCRMLSQHGFTCYNFSGGYRLYKDLFGVKK
ncbi:FAD-dependent oxidoreductase [Synergistaceae bacterium OttesenSCG-928-I11]|nr:FAD-dependent oxidoreductase [Synergistaceae bacterium OttesenSCG-928-I11]